MPPKCIYAGLCYLFYYCSVKKNVLISAEGEREKDRNKKKRERESKKGGREVVAQNEPNEPEAKDEENIKQFALGIEG